MTYRETVLAFVEAINAHDVNRIISLSSEAHVFIDTYGNKQRLQEMKIGWPGYFEWFPDYYIEINDIFQNGNVFAIIGNAGGTFSKSKDNNRWKLPAAWKTEIADGKVKVWQVFCDSKIPFEIINGIS